MNELFFIYNGFLFKSGRPVISGNHPVLQFGDGLFETMRLYNGRVLLNELHKKRLSNGMQVLGFEPPHNFFSSLEENMQVLMKKNQLPEHARIRISVMRASNFFTENDNRIDYIIECNPVALPEFLPRGLIATVYDLSKKGTGILANLKTKNYLLNIQALRYARENNADEAILLNAHNRVCETSVANLFFVENGKIFTPSLTEGCVAGIMRQWLLEKLPQANFFVEETECSLSRLMNADEVFITNAVRWIQPLASIGNKNFKIGLSAKIFDFVAQNIRPEQLKK